MAKQELGQAKNLGLGLAMEPELERAKGLDLNHTLAAAADHIEKQ